MTSDVLLHHFPPYPLETGSLIESGAFYFPTRLAGQSANPSDPPVSTLPYPSSGITGMHSHMWTHVSARSCSSLICKGVWTVSSSAVDKKHAQTQ